MHIRIMRGIHDIVGSLTVWLRVGWERGLALLHVTDLLDRLAVRGATKTDLLLVFDPLTICKMCHVDTAQMHA